MNIRLLVPFALSLAVLPACKTTKYEFETSPPASAGTVEIRMKATESGNGEIVLEFEHLPPPKRVDSALVAYVVWNQSEGRDPAKVGVLDYDAKKRSGNLTATYSGEKMKIIVTLENDAATQSPMGVRILEVDLAAPKSN